MLAVRLQLPHEEDYRYKTWPYPTYLFYLSLLSDGDFSERLISPTGLNDYDFHHPTCTSQSSGVLQKTGYHSKVEEDGAERCGEAKGHYEEVGHHPERHVSTPCLIGKNRCRCQHDNDNSTLRLRQE